MQETQSIGHYLLSSTIGEGTFGKVSLGSHIITGEKVAIKVLEKAKINDSEDLERVLREIKILKQIKHPNSVQLYEIIDTTEHIYLILEYAPEGELFEYIVKNSCLSEKEACLYFLQLLEGVEYLHTLKIAHRDLKPENLLFGQEKVIKIADFGLSNIYEANAYLNTACGSPCYAAPEMIAQEPYDPYKADIWSCGVILYAMVCGFLPFDDENKPVLFKKIRDGSYSTPQFLSEQVKDLLECILNVNPAERFSIPQIKAHPWSQSIVYKSPEISYDIKTEVLEYMERYGYKSEEVLSNLQASNFNHITAAYNLTQLKINRLNLKKTEEYSPLKAYYKYRKKSRVSRTMQKKSVARTRLPPYVNSPKNILNRTAKPVISKFKTVESIKNEPDFVETYNGPFNVGSITYTPLQELIEKIEAALAKHLIAFKKGKNYKFECSLLNQRFALQVKAFEGNQELLVIDIKPQNKDFSQYQTISKQLITSIV